MDVDQLERDPEVQSMLNQLEEEDTDDSQNEEGQFDTEILIDENGNPKVNKKN